MQSTHRQIRLFLILFVFLFLLAACQPKPTVAPPTRTPALPLPSATPIPTNTATAEPTLTPDSKTVYLPEISMQPTPTKSALSLPVVMSAARPTRTPAWSQVKNGKAYAPILIYHHVTDGKPEGRYTVKITTFQEQMQTLRDNGYTAITISTLADALRAGGSLPSKPVVISFDDGNLDVYQNAYPIMLSFGFPGTFYIVAKYLNGEGFVNTGQLNEMIAGGWEVGSHSETHADMSKDTTDLDLEISQSRADLETALGQTVQSFAYPFANGNERVYKKVRAYGYSSAVCSGWSNHQSSDMLFCMPRREVKNTTSLEDFLKLIAVP